MLDALDVCGGDCAADVDADGICDCPTELEVRNDVGQCVCVSGYERADDGSCTPVDLCPTDPDKTVPGICGCGVPDTNADSDDYADCEETCAADNGGCDQTCVDGFNLSWCECEEGFIIAEDGATCEPDVCYNNSMIS